MLRSSTQESEPYRRTVVASDGVHLDTALLRGAQPRTTVAIAVATGFTGSWRFPATRMIAERLRAVGDVAVFDFRGHHASTGVSTVGDREILDLEAVVAHLRELGYTDIATVGFSLGASVAIRHAALFGGVSAVAAVSGPSRWYYRGTLRMRLLHLGVEWSLGRLALRLSRGVRVTNRPWDPIPPDPTEAAGAVSPAPLLVVHGEEDRYFPVEHALRIHEAAAAPKDLWVERGMGHGESAMTEARANRIAAWLGRRLPRGESP